MASAHSRRGFLSFCKLLIAASGILLLVGCAQAPFDPTPVVPTGHPLPYSAKVKVTEVGTFEIEPGSSMGSDPQLQAHVSRATSPLLPTKDPADWERTTVTYLTTRNTFRRVIQEGAADLDLTLRINMYIDPSVASDFSHIYLAVTEATLSDPRTGRSLMQYSGLGRTAGEKKDRAAMERAVHAAYRDLFSKMENDKRLQSL